MPAFLIVRSECVDGNLRDFRNLPTIDIAGSRASLDWGDVTLAVPPGDLPVTVYITYTNGQVEGAMLTVRVPPATGTRLSFRPAHAGSGAAQLVIDGQWPSDSSMHYYAVRDARTLVPAAQYVRQEQLAAAAAKQQQLVDQSGYDEAADTVESDYYGRRIDPDAQGPAPIPTPAEFDRLERSTREAQQREYENWLAQQPDAQEAAANVPSFGHAGAPEKVGLVADRGGAQPGWYQDPFQRAELRWFDGVQWTPSVQSGGQRWHNLPG